MTHQPIYEGFVPLSGCGHTLYRWPNGYGASIISGGSGGYYDARGGLELAVVRYYGEGTHDYNVDESTRITEHTIDGTIGSLTPDRIPPLLDAVAALEPVR